MNNSTVYWGKLLEENEGIGNVLKAFFGDLFSLKLYRQFRDQWFIIIGFALFFTVSYRNVMIDVKYAKIKDLKAELALIQKENEQLQANNERKSASGSFFGQRFFSVKEMLRKIF